jgi:hypothetical protein
MQTERLELRLSPELIRRLDDWRMAQIVPPSRNAAVRHLVEDALARAAPKKGETP